MIVVRRCDNRQALKIPLDKCNVNGGSVAIGHPFGMTGSRQVEQSDSSGV